MFEIALQVKNILMVRKYEGRYEVLPPSVPLDERVRSAEAILVEVGNRQLDMSDSQMSVRRFLYGRDDDPDDVGFRGEIKAVRAAQLRNYTVQRWILILVAIDLLIRGPQGIEHLLSLIHVVPHP